LQFRKKPPTGGFFVSTVLFRQFCYKAATIRETNAMNLRPLPLVALLGFAVAGSAFADTLLIDRVNKLAAAPARGQTTQQVQAHFGMPLQKLEPAGGQHPQWPSISRWVYADFTVYFEKSRVVSTVINKASPDEIGPKPAR
jgi:hypothetical protein